MSPGSLPSWLPRSRFGVIYYGRRLAYEKGIRKLLMIVFLTAFATAAVAGLYGALITKAAPIK